MVVKCMLSEDLTTINPKTMHIYSSTVQIQGTFTFM